MRAASQQLCLTTVHTAHVPYHLSHHGYVSNSERVITTAAAATNNNYWCLTYINNMAMAYTTLPNTEDTLCGGSNTTTTRAPPHLRPATHHLHRQYSGLRCVAVRGVPAFLVIPARVSPQVPRGAGRCPREHEHSAKGAWM